MTTDADLTRERVDALVERAKYSAETDWLSEMWASIQELATIARRAIEKWREVALRMDATIKTCQSLIEERDTAIRERNEAIGEFADRKVALVERAKRAESALAEKSAEVERLAAKLKSARAAMSQANNALESDADLLARRAAFERIQEEFEGVTDAD